MQFEIEQLIKEELIKEELELWLSNRSIKWNMIKTISEPSLSLTIISYYFNNKRLISNINGCYIVDYDIRYCRKSKIINQDRMLTTSEFFDPSPNYIQNLW